MAESVSKSIKLLTVSNRGPVEHRLSEQGEIETIPGQGGLATALRVAAQLHPTVWLSSPLAEADRMIAQATLRPPNDDGSSHFVLADPAAYDLFYSRFSSEALWFLQHSLPWPNSLDAAERERAWCDGYQVVNEAFARAVVDELDSDKIRAVVFHDYHFYLAPRMVRTARPLTYLQHFVHIPWPEPKEWERLESDIVQAICLGLLGNDSVVFQTQESAHNFLQTCAAFLPGCGIDIEKGKAVMDGRTTRVWADAISVDPEELDSISTTPEFSRYRYLLRPGPGLKMIVRVDRLDMSKNIVRGFEAYRLLLRNHPELVGHVCFLALLVPSRSDIESYREYQDEAMATVESINRDYGNLHWKPIRVIFENNRTQALAAMSLYDVLLVNPVVDGMNLVAKEGPIVNTHGGVLVLSHKAGASEELSEAALSIDPFDVDGTAAALYQALMMPPIERYERARRLQSIIRKHDLRAWFRPLLDDVERHTPLPASYVA